MLEERLFEINNDLNSLTTQIFLIQKEGSQISPGLKQSIDALKIKQENLIVNLDLWKIMMKVCPNYDR